jgi:hypothetical protein
MSVIRWLQRALQRAVFAPDPNVYVAGVRAEVLLIRGPVGGGGIAVDSKGRIGAWLVQSAYGFEDYSTLSSSNRGSNGTVAPDSSIKTASTHS